MKVPPFLPALLFRPYPIGTRPSPALLKAEALELMVLAGHVLLYPTGITGERHPAPDPPDPPDPPDHSDPTDPLGPPSPTDHPNHPDPADRPGPTDRSGRTGSAGRKGSAGSCAVPGSAAPAAPPPAVHVEPSAPAGTSALPAEGDERPPVVLLHGFVDNRSVFVLLRRSLARHGWHHLESLNYSPLTCDIRTAAELLGRHVEEICARTGHHEVDIVGHSLGGLIARYYVQRLGGDQRVRTLVTLGTPHQGTAVAPLASAHPIVRQMRTGSAPIKELRRPAPGCRTRFVSFWSELDRVVVPAEAGRIDHPDLDALNVRVTGIGHLALPVHPSVVAAVRQALESGGPTTGTERPEESEESDGSDGSDGPEEAGGTGGTVSAA
ncbi:alpha/beta fold hydrolase [Streptomyces sp. ML-6]|uniref:esterase/lipase family protein n=1 Tax=Streptomyces sp. ML-6 TaxID=2982693 RepID=UPI0024BFD07B|nr:alpha/beta fold hydrolase [Streptomyces sp. ML-6]MDK0521634.1 alpha/beta fold hydrolase [Streptomyces sp. ML-6]